MVSTEELTDDQLAQAGVEEVMSSLRHHHLPNFVIWKPEALQRFDRMFVEDKLNLNWFEDFRATLRAEFGWELGIVDCIEWPNYADTPPKTLAVLEIDRYTGVTERLVVRPEGQIMELVPALSLAL